jgi:sugar (pentulose or hexulose) kinase
MSAILGLDIGTTSVKAALFNLQGDCLGSAGRDYALQTPAVDFVELDPATYWEGACATVQSALQKSGLSQEDVQAIGVSSQGETIIPVAADGKPLHQAIVWLDNRAKSEARALQERLGEEVYQHTGIPHVNPTWSACKIAWLREHNPQVFKDAHRFLLVQDYIVHRLTGEFVTDGAVACTTLLYDILRHAWWPAAMEAVSLEPERLPRIAAPGSIAGGLTSAAAQALKLKEGIPVVLGGMDQAAGAVGAGNLAPEKASETTGGALAVQITVARPDIDPHHRIPIYVHSAPQRYLLVPVCDTGGMALKWFRDTFASAEMAQAAVQGLDVYDLLTEQAATVAPGSDGLLMLPHLMGAFSPEYDPQARGVFFGFTLYHRREHFTRAVLEAVAFMLRRNLELILQAGIPIAEVRATGGGARSRLWRQIKADVCGMPVLSLRHDDTALLGDAMLAAVALGHFPSLEEAARSMVAIAERLTPDAEHARAYARCYQNYCALYDALAPVFNEQFASA